MIFIDDRQSKVKVDNEFCEKLKSTINFTLEEELVKEKCEISLIFVDNEEIREINKETRGIDKATDVLSFPMLEFPKGKVYKDAYVDHKFEAMYFDGEELVLGDIVLSLEMSMEQSKEFNHSFLRESCYLVIHSVLHLLGYDHMEEEEKRVMRIREEELLTKLNVTRND